jgi:hypothetical protein
MTTLILSIVGVLLPLYQIRLALLTARAPSDSDALDDSPCSDQEAEPANNPTLSPPAIDPGGGETSVVGKTC